MPVLMTKLSGLGRVTQLLARASRRDGFEKSAVHHLDMTFAGIVGDCHGGLTRKSDSRTLKQYARDTDIRNVRQATLLSVEELQDIAASMKLPQVAASWLGANLVVKGIPDFTLLPPSSRLQFSSGATLVVDMENFPCSQVAKLIAGVHPEAGPHFVKAAMHKRGVTAWVECEGKIGLGDEIMVWIPQQRIYAHS
jgi:hypothetical protein